MTLVQRAKKLRSRKEYPVNPRSSQEMELAKAWFDGEITSTGGASVKGFSSAGHFITWAAYTLREARRLGEI